MNDTVRVRISLGLIVCFVLPALVQFALFNYFANPAIHADDSGPPPTWRLPAAEPTPCGQINERVLELQKPAPPVNQAAQQELKQGIFFNRRSPQPTTTTEASPSACSTCSPAQMRPVQYATPTYVPNYVAPVAPSAAFSPPVVINPRLPVQPPAQTVAPRQPSSSEIMPPAVLVPAQNSSEPILTPANYGADKGPPVTSSKYQLALFLGTDAKSKTLIDWFKTDSELLKLRSQCDFNYYTVTSPLYRERFAATIPVEQFPVFILQDNTGGHIHAAARNMIPDSAAALISDCKTGYKLYSQAKSAEKTGLIKTSGYSWDAAIDPSMQLSAEDCGPDGCRPNSNDPWRPGDRVRDVLFDAAADSTEAVLWANASEIGFFVLIVVAVFLVVFIALKRGLV